uniref:Azaphilone pigments biosynthesis cluster protein L N-terminal domain-containing protein n=1 Tax=Pyricularia oryzae (strain P131) TaxID=1143193 RepID=L7JB99_PYRO1
MTDPLSTASGVVALVTFALQSSVTLHRTIRSLRSQEKDARALKDELADLTSVLETLLETIEGHPNIDFGSLALPLQRCGKTCQEYGELIAKCTRHSTSSRASLRDWITQRYLQGDINDFRNMLSGSISNLLKRKLATYKSIPQDDEAEWEALSEEKESTEQGLKLCAQLSAQIEQFMSLSAENPQFSSRPSAHKHIKSGLGPVGASLQSLLLILQKHESSIKQQMEALRVSGLHGDATAQIESLEETKTAIRQCIHVVSDADETVREERRNVFADITMADDSYAFSVSTVGDLVTARGFHLSGRARHVGGQISDESYQMTVDALTKLDLAHSQSTRQNSQDHGQKTHGPTPVHPETGGTKTFQDRYGRGMKLSLPNDGNRTPDVP